MRKLITVVILYTLTFNILTAQELRDPAKWPFSRTSIWNMPIGSGARYVHAEIQKSTAYGMTADEDIIVTAPGEKLMEVYENYAGWNRDKNRCIVEGPLMFAAPIPFDFIVSPDTWDGLTPNSGLAVVMPDGRTIKQTQPFAHCAEGPKGTSRYTHADVDIYGNGHYGMHGGSGLSAIGGTLRLGELTPESGPIRHAIKVNLFGKKNYYYDDATKGYRWPARRADGYAKGNYGSLRKNPVKALRMGALLALPVWMSIDSLGLETEPAKLLAEAFQNYGGYVVDDSAWDVYAIVTEWSPDGNFADEFRRNWGFSFSTSNKNTPWGRDMDRIFLNLYVVDNNGPDSIGGGGIPVMPLAPDFLPLVNITLETDGTEGVVFTRPDRFTASSETSTKIIIAKVPEGYKFKNWEVTEGDALVAEPEIMETTIQVKIKDSRIRANFEKEYFSIHVDVSGNGTIITYPDQGNYLYGTEIQLTANPDPGWEFTEWQGDISGAQNPVTIVLTSAIDATAVFKETTSAGVRNKEIPDDFQMLYNNTLQNLQFSLPAAGKECSISIFSVHGKKLREVKTLNNEIIIPVQDLYDGTYVVTLTTENGWVKSFRFVKTK